MPDRRDALRLLAAAAAGSLAGCGAGGVDPELQGPVAEAYRTATALDGTERDPDALYSKGGVNYHAAQGSARCSNCAYYVPDRDGDGLGACAVVEGYVRPDGWCNQWRRAGGTEE